MYNGHYETKKMNDTEYLDFISFYWDEALSRLWPAKERGELNGIRLVSTEEVKRRKDNRQND